MKPGHLLRHRPRVEVVHDEQPRRLIDHLGMRFGQQPGLLRRIETRLRLLQFGGNFGVIKMAPVVITDKMLTGRKRQAVRNDEVASERYCSH